MNNFADLQEKLHLKNVMQTPKIVKVVVSGCYKEALGDEKVLSEMSEQLALITGQKPMVTKSRKSIAVFKLREGQPLGLMATLRGKRARDFLTRLVMAILPRVRDFHGLDAKGFDSNGNYTIGFKEQIVFPEIDYGKISKLRGLEATIVTTAKNPEEGKALLESIGLPFKK